MLAPAHAKSERAIQTHLSPFIDSIIGNVLRFLKQSLYLLQGFLQDTPAGHDHHHTLNPPAPLTLNRPPTAHWTLAALFRFPASCLFAVFVFCLHFFFFVCFELCSNSTVDCLLCVALTLFSLSFVLFGFVEHFCTVCCYWLTLQHHLPRPSAQQSLIFSFFVVFFFGP